MNTELKLKIDKKYKENFLKRLEVPKQVDEIKEIKDELCVAYRKKTCGKCPFLKFEIKGTPSAGCWIWLSKVLEKKGVDWSVHLETHLVRYNGDMKIIKEDLKKIRVATEEL